MKYPEKYRAIHPMGFDYFRVPYKGYELSVIASIEEGWEHVSVSFPTRNPSWDEMCHIKKLFWNDDEECIQFHPKNSDYVNLHNFCLHIWKPPFEIRG